MTTSANNASEDGATHAQASDIPADSASRSREVLAMHSRSFDLASRFLPPDSRDDAAGLYAFCRFVDDAVDEARSPEVAAESIERLRAELSGTLPAGPTVAAYLALANRRGIDVAYALELVRGVASDLDEVRMPDDRALLRYCYRVAGTVGLMMARILSVEAARALPHAIDLGIAMQLTNICRDVLEDAQNGRIYLPQTRLTAAGTSAEGLLNQVPRSRMHAAAVSSVVAGLLELADQYYASADQGMRYIPTRTRLAICVAARVYRGIGVRLRRRHGANPMHGRTVLPKLEKLFWIAPALQQCTSASLTSAQPHRAQLHRALSGLPGVNA
jgi:phytoene synthase